jgi:hypothetical protein
LPGNLDDDKKDDDDDDDDENNDEDDDDAVAGDGKEVDDEEEDDDVAGDGKEVVEEGELAAVFRPEAGVFTLPTALAGALAKALVVDGLRGGRAKLGRSGWKRVARSAAVMRSRPPAAAAHRAKSATVTSLASSKKRATII